MSKVNMDDASLLNWLQENAVSMSFQSPQGTCEITYGRGGATSRISGTNLRETIQRAVAQQGGETTHAASSR